jgi:hypothetical protein
MRVAQAHRGMVLGLFIALVAVLIGVPIMHGADHRDAPLANEDPAADINDVYVFVSPTDPTKVVFAMTVNGFAVPAVRSSYSLGPEVLYQFKIDNNGDAREDLVIQVTADGYESLRDARCPASAGGGGQFVNVVGPVKPAHVGNQGHLVKKGPEAHGCTNVILNGTSGIRAWAGLVEDPFVVDIGQLNRILGGTQEVFREVNSPVLGPLRGRPLASGGNTSGVDSFGGFNATGIAVEVPIALVQGTAKRASSYLQSNTTIGVWGTTGRGKNRHLSAQKDPHDSGPFVQVQRMGHQVFKTVFLPTSVKDAFNRSEPTSDNATVAQFIPDALTTSDNDGSNNTIAARAQLLTDAGVATAPGGAPLLLGGALGNTDKNLIRKVLIPDVLRINLAAPATDVGVASNGLQNGRRYLDDVIDIVLLLSRELADVKFPDATFPAVPGSGRKGTRRALDCSALPCPDRRVLAVLQGTDFIKPDAALTDLSTNGTDRPLTLTFPFFGIAHPLPGAAGTTGFPPQQ